MEGWLLYLEIELTSFKQDEIDGSKWILEGFIGQPKITLKWEQILVCDKYKITRIQVSPFKVQTDIVFHHPKFIKKDISSHYSCLYVYAYFFPF